ncbi:kinase-like domain-containing protein [Hyaloraphidium curvatum]|nr:kinase-like domain-containing protein [Hyaloraphidium curvatum]
MAPAPVPRTPPASGLSMRNRAGNQKKPMSLSALGNGAPMANAFRDFSRYVDPSGKLQFSGKAVIHADGVDFSGGKSYRINMSELAVLEELGKGQYGTVHKVRHEPTGVVMAMKEIRLELDQAKLNAILMELDVLHKAVSPYIVEFYGAFFVESCVYYCMEFMDFGSLDRLEVPDGLPEPILAKTAHAMVHGLRFLKDELSIIHRDIKPTNVLVNSSGEVKLCDFGVSGQLMNSLAKTNIGCQPYMAPERITFEQAQTYTVASDVWSLGIALVEMGSGKYPYPTEASVFAQLTAIVQGEAPSLPPEHYSEECRDFIAQCLHKEPKSRPNYTQLAAHPWLLRFGPAEVDVRSWASAAHEAYRERTEAARREQQAKEEAQGLLRRSQTDPGAGRG